MSWSRVTQVAIITTTLITLSGGSPSIARELISREDRFPNAQWFEFKKARYYGRPILLHLKSRKERAVLMPEPIRLLNEKQVLPDCAVEINHDVVGFFSTHDFKRMPIKFIGLHTQIIYELRVRSSEFGVLEPLQILR